MWYLNSYSGDDVLGRRKKEEKKKKNVGKIILVVILLILLIVGSYLGYSIAKNGGGLQGILATILGQDMEELENVGTIDVLLMRR